MKFLSDILAKAGLVVEGSTTLNGAVSATVDTDKFMVLDGSVVKYRTGTQLLSDIGGQASLTNPITGTGTSGQIAYWSGSNTQTGSNNLFWDATNSRLGIGTNSPLYLLDANGAARFNGNVLITSANNRYLGFEGFTTGMTVDFRFGDINNRVACTYASTLNVESYHGVQISNSNLGSVTNAALRVIGRQSGKAIIELATAATQYGAMFYSGNLLLQNGGTFTDAGYRLEVSGTTRLSSTVIVNAATVANSLLQIKGTGTGSTTYQIYTQNSTGTKFFYVRDDGVVNASDISAVTGQYGAGTGTQTPLTALGGSANIQFTFVSGSTTANIYNSSGGGINFKTLSAANALLINNNGSSVFSSSVTASSFIKSGGTSAQFLKADGSVDSNTYLTSYTETDTLSSVTARGASTSTTLDLNGRVNIGNSLTRPAALNSDAAAHARIGGADVHLYVASLGAASGYKVAVQAARTSDFQSFDLDLQSNGGTLSYGGVEVVKNTGTWGINITGNAATATSATSATYSPNLSNQWINNGTTFISVYDSLNNSRAAINFIYNTSDMPLSGGLYSVLLNKYDGSYGSMLAMNIEPNTGNLYTKTKYNNSWSAWKTLLDSSNYNSYAPTLTGSGASGSWGIDITGTSTKTNGLLKASEIDLNAAFTNTPAGQMSWTESYNQSNAPTASTYYNTISMRHGNASNVYGTQFSMNWIGSEPHTYIRVVNNNVFGTWRVVLTDFNYASYALPLTGGTLTGSLAGTSATFSSSVTASSLIKSGGTSTQFLKADGSVDSNTYLTSYTETDTLSSVTARGASTSSNVTFSGITRLGTSGYSTYINGGLMFRDYGNNALTNGRFYYQDDAWHFRGGGEGEADLTSDTAMYIRSGNVERLVLHDGNISLYAVPTSRTITINGTALDLSANRSFTVTASETDTLASVTGRGATTTAAITVTASEGREVSIYIPSSYTTDDLVSGHEYGWYNDHWRLGMTRSGASPGADFVIQWNGARRFSLTNNGNLTTTGTIAASNLSGTNTGDQTNISGNAATATNVAWTGVTGRPTALSSFTNDLGNYGGWISSYTETDTLATVTGRGASTSSAISINNQLVVTDGRVTVRTGGANTYGIVSGYDNNNHLMTFRAAVSGSTASPTFTAGHQMTFVEYAQDNDTTGWYFKSSSNTNYEEIARITRSTFNYNGHTVIHSGNIASQSVNYATSAGTATNSSQLNGLTKAQLWNNSGQNHTTYQSFGAIPNFGVWFMQNSSAGDTPQSGSQFYVQTQGLGNDYGYGATSGNYGIMTAVARDHARKYTYYRTLENGGWNAWSKAAAGYADEAGSVAWTNVSSRPTALSQFSNDLGNYGGWITGYTETDTLASVTARGATTSTAVTFNSALTIGAFTQYSIYVNGPAANFGNGRVYLRLHTTASGARIVSFQIKISSQWNYADAFGNICADVSYYFDGTNFYNATTTVTSATGSARINLTIGNPVIENGYVSIPIYSVNTNPVSIKIEGSPSFDYSLTSVTSWASAAFPGTTVVNIPGSLTIAGNTAIHAGNYNSYAPTLGGTGASGTWGISITGNADTVDGYHASTSIVGNNIVVRDGSGYIFGNYINTTDDVTGGISYIVVKNGDNYHRSASASTVQSFLGLGSMAYASTGSYLPLGGGTMTGKITTPSSAADTYGGAIEIRERGYVLATQDAWSYSPAITFHWGNRHAQRFGVRADGLLALDDAPIAMRSWVQAYSPTLTGGNASGTWSINVTGSSGSVSGLTLTSGANGINPDSVTQNQIGYNTSVSLFGQTDGGLYSSAYSSSWIHQIYGDFRTGQIAIRGKNSGTWQAWRTVLDSSNYSSYSPTLSGTGASGTWGISISGNAATVGGYGVSTGVGANTVVVRDASGYVFFNYINSNVSETENPIINSFYTSNGDGYFRKSSLAHVRSQLGNYGGWITGYTETDTLASVTARGATTTGAMTVVGSLTVSSNNVTGGGIILADDGDIVDLNDGYCSMRFSSGVRIFSANRGGSAVITLGSSGTVSATSFVKSGGTSAQILAADGSIITAGTNITISGGTISSTASGGVTGTGTANYLTKWSGTGSGINDSAISQSLTGNRILIGASDDATSALQVSGVGRFTGGIDYNVLKPTTTTTASTATLSPNVNLGDTFTITSQAAALSVGIPTGTMFNGQKLLIRIKDNGTARAITWTTGVNGYRASSDLAFPTTTIINKTMYVGFIYNITDQRWDMIALLNNF